MRYLRQTNSLLLASAVLTTALSACTPAKWHEVAPNTGVERIEKQTAPPAKQPTKQGDEGFVVPERLRGRKNPNQPAKDSPVLLEPGDKVKVTNPNPQGPNDLIEVEIVDSKRPDQPKGPIYIPKKYISVDPPVQTPEQRDAYRYFMIQNIATEKLRVYERCGASAPEAGAPCRHRLVLETDMVAGEFTPDGERQSILGSFTISKWFKFYEDTNGHFPAWYHPRYPELPPPGASWADWLSKSLLPEGRGIARGKFGWYTAHLEPNAYAQWTHGTIGWGADGDRFIQITRDPVANEYGDPRSAGCTRVENAAIAFIRQLLPVGTRVFKVYAREAYREAAIESAPAKQIKWPWILTKEGYMRDGRPQDGPLSDASEVLARGVTEDQILERGVYTVDQKPDAIPLRTGVDSRTTNTGNLYEIAPESFQGYLVVDEGRLVNYEHPQELFVGGIDDQLLPADVVSSDASVALPTGRAAAGKHASKEKEKALNREHEGRRDGKLNDGTVMNEKSAPQG